MNEQLIDSQLETESSAEVLAKARTTLVAAKGPQFWQSLEALVSDNKVVNALKTEYPRQFADWETLGRRDFLKLMGASLALAGLTACTKQPVEKIVPYVQPPEDLIPGKPLMFATAITLGGFGMGVLAESHMGRPTKLEGNPDHPSSLGSTDALVQASVLSLYDPERSQAILFDGKASSWDAYLAALAGILESAKATQGAGLRLLTETVTSPTLASAIQALLTQYPSAVWHQYEPINRDNSHDGAMLAFGEGVDTIYHFDKADIVVSLDADFMSWGAGRVRYARDFSQRRLVTSDHPNLNRLYVAEPMPSCTGSIADHRLPLSPADLELLVRSIAHHVGIAVETKESPSLHAHEAWITALSEDLKSHPGKGIVVAGESLSPTAHALVHAINDALGNVGQTMVHTVSVEARPVNQTASLRELTTAISAGSVETLLILGANPVYTAPTDVEFGNILSKVKNRIHLGAYADETARACTWHIPEAHTLEAWGDVCAHDGTVTIMQPLIEPLYADCKSALELLSSFSAAGLQTAYQQVREFWKAKSAALDFEAFWRSALHDGIVPNTAATVKAVKPVISSLPAVTETPTELQIAFRPDSSAWDGRFASNGWLQEAPRPITKLVWDNAALISPALATKLGVADGDVVTITVGGKTVDAPVWKQPGVAAGTVIVNLGYGRRKPDGEPLHPGYGRRTPDTNPLHVVYGAEGEGTGGFNAYVIRSSTSPWLSGGATLTPTGRKHLLVSTQEAHKMGDEFQQAAGKTRNQIRYATVAQLAADPHFVKHGAEFGEEPITVLKGHPEDGNQWAMTINLNACIGCNACLVSCQSENNIPIVSKDQVANGREMHWIRIDRYFEGDPENPSLHSQPVPCMHCENAPCELVCPVAATTHDNEGLNQMVYNRCVGTRYCSNNCPYKVRRFNYYKFSEMTGQDSPAYMLQRNPDVTVRARGVMEKCTYCVQRISEARIASKKEDRPIRDGEVVTACQQACPTRAIVFGNINDPDSAISKTKASDLNYSLLSELNARPRTTYLAKIRNPNPALESAPAAAETSHHHGDA